MGADHDQHNVGPEFRKAMRNPQLGACLDHCGGARKVLAAALEAVRRSR
jgi:hypothetical protein